MEEYGYPGGFPEVMRRAFTWGAHLVTPGFAVVVNGLFLAACAVAAVMGAAYPVFALSIAVLVGLNGLVHLAVLYQFVPLVYLGLRTWPK